MYIKIYKIVWIINICINIVIYIVWEPRDAGWALLSSQTVEM